MDEQQVFGTMWSMGFGNMNDVLFGEDADPRPHVRAIRSDWETHRMPRRSKTRIRADIPLTKDEFETLAWGHVPQQMEDHWFMYFDGESFNFHRSWTGFCIYRMHVKRDGDGYLVHCVTANRRKDQYSMTNDRADGIMAEILVTQALGKDADSLWERYFEAVEQDQ